MVHLIVTVLGRLVLEGLAGGGEERLLERVDAVAVQDLRHGLEEEQLAERVGILDRGQLIELAPADELKRKYGAETLEEAFFAATGKAFEDEPPEDGDD